VVDALRRTELFGALDEAGLERLAREAQLMRFAGNEVVIRQGDPGDAAFVTVSGRLRVVRRDNARRRARLTQRVPMPLRGEVGLGVLTE
jgi:CRP-like cAMP-binding protein